MRRAAACLGVALLIAGCGDGDSDSTHTEVDAAVRVAERYMTALSRNDAAAACRQLTDSARQQVAAYVREARLGIGSTRCQAVVAWALRQTDATSRASLRAARITGAERRGDAVTVTFSGTGQLVTLTREGRRWRIDRLPLLTGT